MTATAGGPDPDRLWAEAQAVYGRPDVAEMCLALQDVHGLDVDLVLWCLCAAERGIVVDDAMVRDARARTAEWDAEVVQPLRRVRRWLKQAEPLPGVDDHQDLRAGVAEAELAAERLQLRALERLLTDRPIEPVAGPAMALARANLDAYLAGGGLGGPSTSPGDPPHSALVDRLVAAALAVS